MEYISEEQQALINLSQNVQNHKESTIIAKQWTSPQFVFDKIKTLNQSKDILEEQETKLSNLNQEIKEIAKKENLTNEEKKILQQKVLERDKQIKIVKENRQNYDQKYQEANQYLRLNTNSNTGNISTQFINYNEKQNGNWKTISIFGNETNIPEGFSPKQRYIYKDEAANNIQNIISVFQSGDYDQLTNEDFQKLFADGFKVDGDAYNILTDNIIDIKFKYNIKRNFTGILNDIRNIKNFRSSNIGEGEEARLDVGTGDFINPVTADGTNGSKSFYMSRNDFYWSQNYNDLTNEYNVVERQSIPNIILNEYQPTLMYNIGKQIFSEIDNSVGGTITDIADSLLDKAGLGGMTDFFGIAAEHGVEKLYNDKIREIGNRPEKLYAEENYESKTNPMYYIEHLFNNGIWLNTYELPFINDGQVKTDYLQNASDPGAWTVGGLTDDLGEESLITKIQHDRISLSLPASPTFNLNNAHKSTLSPINISFYLINKDDIYLDKNFQFMQALFAGTQWLAMTFGSVVATNVYHVLVPDRFQIHWAYLGSKFEAMGKLRTNNHMYAKHGQNIKMINIDTLWPEAWHVSLTITPLSPWNFNTHMAYYLNGFGAAQRNRLDTMKTAWWNTGVSLKNQQNQIKENQKRMDAMGTKLRQHNKAMGEYLNKMDKYDFGSKQWVENRDKAIEEYKKAQKYYQAAKTYEQQYVDAMVEAGMGSREQIASQMLSEQYQKAMDSAGSMHNNLVSRVSNTKDKNANDGWTETKAFLKGAVSFNTWKQDDEYHTMDSDDEYHEVQQGVKKLWTEGIISYDEYVQKSNDISKSYNVQKAAKEAEEAAKKRPEPSQVQKNLGGRGNNFYHM